MRREDLVRLATAQVWVGILVLSIVLGGFALSMYGALEKIHPSLSPAVVLPVLFAVAAVLLVVFAMGGYVGNPRCPHCKRLLTRWLIHIAIASGNCGYCGRSIEEPKR